MSYCRWSDGLLYVYLSREGLVCCGCYETTSRTDMARHIREHAETDDEVQTHVADELLAEAAEVGDDVMLAWMVDQP